MKKAGWLTLALVLMFGCSRYHGIQTGEFASSFTIADQALKVEAEAIVKFVREGKLPEAVAELQKLAKRAKLSAEQQQAVRNLIQQIQTKVEADAKKAAEKKS